MSHKRKISIPKPCHENWFEMSITEKGRFCANCQKEVIDFTNSSDREIIKKFDSYNNLCGRFSVNQINRKLIIPKEKKSIWLATVSTIISILNFGNQELTAQESVKLEQTESKKNENKLFTYNDNKEEEIEIEGKIFLDETNPNYEEVDILLYDKNQIFHPNAEGKFCIKTNKNARILISKAEYINYYTTVFTSINLGAIELERDNCKTFILGGAITVKRNFWHRLFHKN